MNLQQEIESYMQLNLPEDVMMLVMEADNFLLEKKTLYAKKKMEQAKKKLAKKKINI